jgi:uncharacterized protein YjiS (DUF1127 family)
MSIGAQLGRRLARRQFGGRANHLLTEAACILAAWLERRRQRRALLELNDHLLKDIGIGRGDAYREGSKPFWRD